MDTPDDTRGNSKLDTNEASGGHDHKGIGLQLTEDTQHASNRTRWQRLGDTLVSHWPTIIIGVLTLILGGLTLRNDMQQSELQNQQLRFQETVQAQTDNIRATQWVVDSRVRATMDAQTEAQIAIQKAQATIDHDKRNIETTQVAIARDLNKLIEQSELAFIKPIGNQTRSSLQELTLDSSQNLLVAKGVTEILLENSGSGSTILTTAEFLHPVTDERRIEITYLSAIGLNSVLNSDSSPMTTNLPFQVTAHSGFKLFIQWKINSHIDFNGTFFRLRELISDSVNIILLYSNEEKSIIDNTTIKLDYSPFIQTLQPIKEGVDNSGGLCPVLIPWYDMTDFVFEFEGVELDTAINRCYSFPSGESILVLSVRGDDHKNRVGTETRVNVLDGEIYLVNLAPLLDQLESMSSPNQGVLLTVTPEPTHQMTPSIADRLDGWLLVIVSLVVALLYIVLRLLVRVLAKPPEGYVLFCRGHRPLGSVISLRRISIAKRIRIITIGGNKQKVDIYCEYLSSLVEFKIRRVRNETIVYRVHPDRTWRAVARLKQGSISEIQTSDPRIVIKLSLDPDQLRCEPNELYE